MISNSAGPHANRRLVILATGLTSYFSLFLVAPGLFPSLGSSGLFWTGLLIFSASLISLAALIGWLVITISISRIRKHPLGSKTKLASRFASTAVLTLALVIFISRIIPDTLPSGSYASHFDRPTWLNEEATTPVTEGITSRQKMLADAVSRLPGLNRRELESVLGPSLQTEYFQSSGRDLIYYLGPQRDSLFPIDSEWLLIWIDESGKFERFAIVSD